MYIRGSKNISTCDLVLSDPAANELVWFLARSNACSLWLLPVLYVFMPPIKCFRRFIRNLKRKFIAKESKRKSGLNEDDNDDETNNNDSYISDEDYLDDEYDSDIN